MTRSLDDHTLVAACRAGQTEAFGALVLRYQERLYQTILRLTGSAEDANDVLQDTFLRSFEKLDQFQGDSSFYTWVYRIAVNLALTGYRRRHAAHSQGKASIPVIRTEDTSTFPPKPIPLFPWSVPSESELSRLP